MSDETSGLHVLHVQIDNVLKVVRADVDLGDGVVVISGDNAQGKSSFLNGIEMAILGKRAEPTEPIHGGAKHGRVEVVLGRDGKPRFTVERTFRIGAASKLVVRAADGVSRASPQDMLDELIGLRTWDPLDFAKPAGEKTPAGVAKRQREILLRSCPIGIDLDKWKATRDVTFSKRSDYNRDVKTLEANVAAVPVVGDVDADEDSSALRSSLRDAQEARAAQGANERERWASASAVTDAEALVGQCEVALANAERALEDAVKRREVAHKTAHAPIADAAVIEAEIATMAARNRDRAVMRERKANRAALLDRLTKAQEAADALTARLATMDEERKSALRAAKFPIPGLSIDEDGVVYNGRPFTQASSAEEIEVSLAIGAALAGTLKTMFIRDGGNLDRRTLARIVEWAEANGHQIIIERVAQDVPGAFVFEGGEIVRRVPTERVSS